MPGSESNLKDRGTGLPLTAAQLGVWFAQKLDPANPSYNIAQSTEIYGPVDPTLFKAAVTQALIETEALRVHFIEEEDGPRQVIGPPSESPISLLDVSAELDPEAAAEAWMKADLAKRSTFCMARSSVLRCSRQHLLGSSGTNVTIMF